MNSRKRVIEKDCLLSEELPIPTPEMDLIKGKAYKQRGRAVDINGTHVYFIERIPDTEGQMEVYNVHADQYEQMLGALFELWLRQEGTWYPVGMSYVPLEDKFYDPNNLYIA